ncbi:MAG: DUF3563 domain-containing protein [Devosia sp.]
MGVFKDIRTALRSRSREDIELDYLNGSSSLVDLELRQREVDKGRFRHLPRRGF